jgi:hypothetical protein
VLALKRTERSTMKRQQTMPGGMAIGVERHQWVLGSGCQDST